MGTSDRAADGSDESYTFRFAPSEATEPVSTICRGVAWVTGSAATDLEPLGRVVDADALLRQFDGGDLRGASADRLRGGPTVSFEYEGCVVTVEYGTVVVEPMDRGPT